MIIYRLINKYTSISKIGSWDLNKGGSVVSGYQNLNCSKMAICGDKRIMEMNCKNFIIDLNKGLIKQKIFNQKNREYPIKRALVIMNGQIVSMSELPIEKGYTLQIIQNKNDKLISVHLIDDTVYFSNFNQMFILGKYDINLFEETMISYPFPLSRLYRFKFPSNSAD